VFVLTAAGDDFAIRSDSGPKRRIGSPMPFDLLATIVVGIQAPPQFNVKSRPTIDNNIQMLANYQQSKSGHGRENCRRKKNTWAWRP
jgi:hypothetical protein